MKTTTEPGSLTPLQWQTQFKDALFGNISPELQAGFSKDISPAEQQQRFAVYQNNVFYSLTNALADLYPTIKKLVGEEFFNATAQVYIRNKPPAKAAMVYFAWDFADFLQDFEHTQSMPYLADVARLELARHRAYHAADTACLSSEDFTQISPEVFEQSQVAFHPSWQLLQSDFPIFSIWQANQEESFQENIDLTTGQAVIVIRKDYDLLVFDIDAASYRFYWELNNEKTIYEAAAISQQQYPDMDIGSAITLGIQHGFFRKLFSIDN